MTRRPPAAAGFWSRGQLCRRDGDAGDSLLANLQGPGSSCAKLKPNSAKPPGSDSDVPGAEFQVDQAVTAVTVTVTRGPQAEHRDDGPSCGPATSMSRGTGTALGPGTPELLSRAAAALPLAGTQRRAGRSTAGP